MDQEEGISAEEQARRRLRSKQPDRRPDDETVSKRMKREATIATIKQEIQNCHREARCGTGTQILCTHQNTEEPRVESCIKNGGDSTSGEKEVWLKGGVDRQQWQQVDKCSMRVGWMNNTRRSHDTW